MRSNANPVSGGESRPAFNWDGIRLKQYCGQLALAGAASVVATAGQIPVGFVPFAAALRADVGGVTLTTATRLALGLAAANPMSLCISGTSMAAQAQTIQMYRSPGLIFNNTIAGTAGGASSTAAATISAFSGQTVTPIVANSLKPGDIIRIRGGGTIGWGTDGTAIVKVLIGTDVVALSPTITPADGDCFTFDVDVTVRTIGATGTLVSVGRISIGTASVVAGAADAPAVGTFLGSTAVDTTAAITPTCTIIFSTSQAAHNGTMLNYSIEHIRQTPLANGVTTAAYPLVTCVNNAGVLTGTGVGNVTYSIWGYEIPPLPSATV